MNKRSSENRTASRSNVTRRKFLSTTAAGTGICDSTGAAELVPNIASPSLPYHFGTGKSFDR